MTNRFYIAKNLLACIREARTTQDLELCADNLEIFRDELSEDLVNYLRAKIADAYI